MDYLPKGQVSAEVLVHTVSERHRAISHLAAHRGAEERRWKAVCSSARTCWARSRRWSGWQTRRDAWSTRTGSGSSTRARAWRKAARWGATFCIPKTGSGPSRPGRRQAETGSVFEIEHRLEEGVRRGVPMAPGAGDAIPRRRRAGSRAGLGPARKSRATSRPRPSTCRTRNCRALGGLREELRTSSTTCWWSFWAAQARPWRVFRPRTISRETLQDVVQAGERAAELTRKLLAYAGKAQPVHGADRPQQAGSRRLRFPAKFGSHRRFSSRYWPSAICRRWRPIPGRCAR